jgi:hypothetical protein
MNRNYFLNFKPLLLTLVLPIVITSSCKEKQKQEEASIMQEENAEKRIQIFENTDEKKADILIDGKLFTSYRYPENIKKPILYPLITPHGTKITRKFPLEPSVGEHVDHPHHVGVWFNYGDVNGLDFWNNSDSIKVADRDKYGTILHKKIVNVEEGDDEGRLEVAMDWLDPDGKILLNEHTTFVFRGSGDEFSIDRITKLTAPNEDVNFNDNKEGLIGIRVTRELEHPSDEPGIFTDANGIPTKVPVLDNEGMNGNYINAEGVEGIDTWGKRSKWVNLRSSIGDEKISLVIIDHKSNIGYPTYWHSRGYGLFAANPLGQSVFSDGKKVLNFKLNKGESTTFKYRIIVASKILEKESLNERFQAFTKED